MAAEGETQVAGTGVPTGTPLRVGHLKRYKDIAQLVFRYSDAPVVRTAGLGPDPGDALTEDGKPEALADDLESMGPTFVKLGQLLSTRPDLLPPPYLAALSRLQDHVEPFPWDEVEALVEQELGVRISKAFEGFEREPLAAASLGQVHRAWLRDREGREGPRAVAVKVQRPGVRETIERDLEVLGELAKFAEKHTEAGRKYAFAALLEEFRKSLMAELDYRIEARNLEAMASILEDYELLVVPRPVHDYTSGRVLTMELVRGRNLGKLSPLARLEMNGTELLEQLFRGYLEQAIVHGFLHADPHPGNVFLTDDGRLALLDLGMVLHIGEDMRQDILRLLIAIGDGDEAEAADLCESMGSPRTGYDRKGFLRAMGELVGRARERERADGSVQMGRLVLGVARLAGDHGLRPPPELSLIGKTLLNLDGIAELLDPAFRPTEAIRRHTASLTQRSVLRSLSPGAALKHVLEAKEFAEELPGRVNRALDAIAGNDLEVRVRVIDESRMLTGLQQMANRITMGLVLAALIVGAALLMSVETNLTLFGYPAFAILFFLLAAAGGVALVYRIWRGDRETRREVENR